MKRKYRIVMMALVVAVLAGVLVFVSCQHARFYRVTVLPRLGTVAVMPWAINDKGQIVGVRRGRFYLWERGKDWRELGRAYEGLGLFINNAGQIAGTTGDPNGGQQAFLWDPNDGLIMLGTLLGTGQSTTVALNNRGQMMGLHVKDRSVPQVFLWDKVRGMRAISELKGIPRAMNDAGQVIEYLALRGRQDFLWEPHEDGSVTETLLPSGILPKLKNNGYIFGQAFNVDEKRHYAFIWHQGHDVEWLFPLEKTARVTPLNDANQVAVCEERHSGWLERLTGRRYGGLYKESFVWTRATGRVFLDGYVLTTGGEYFEVRGMNNHGCIIGTVNWWKTGDARRAVLLELISQRQAK
jgi:probable HAF family extracellular repeat protein